LVRPWHEQTAFTPARLRSTPSDHDHRSRGRSAEYGDILLVELAPGPVETRGLDSLRGQNLPSPTPNVAGKTPAELEDTFLDLELITDDLWHFPVAGGTGLSLSSDTSAEGNFAGLSSDGTWILALQCTTCANPAPPFLTVLKVCE
ncbi:MAG: hypothetical protein GXP62_07875, partial [Oligoflexia bacterium]|nr:hypothetical protein [Oligoflexia bacterium]